MTVGFRFSICLAMALMVVVLSAQSNSSLAAPSAGVAHTFEVVSIKASKPSDGFQWSMRNNSFSASGITPMQLLYLVFHQADGAHRLVSMSQFVGVPKWAEKEQFNISAKADEEVAAELAAMSFQQRTDEYGKMLQAVMADRFALKVHRELRKQPIYLLQVSPKGLKLLESDKSSRENSFRMGDGWIKAKRYKIEDLVSNLSSVTGRVVVDKTGLSELYDYTLLWKPDDDTDPNNTNPSLLTALQEQLGLILVPSTDSVEMLVVDHMDRPTEN